MVPGLPLRLLLPGTHAGPTVQSVRDSTLSFSGKAPGTNRRSLPKTWGWRVSRYGASTLFLLQPSTHECTTRQGTSPSTSSPALDSMASMAPNKGYFPPTLTLSWVPTGQQASLFCARAVPRPDARRPLFLSLATARAGALIRSLTVGTGLSLHSFGSDDGSACCDTTLFQLPTANLPKSAEIGSPCCTDHRSLDHKHRKA